MSAMVSVTWWGHATTTITLAGRRILTDPVFSRRVAFLSRIGGPVPSDEAAAADVALVSHLHFDHLHVPSLRSLDPRMRFVGPPGAAAILARAAPAFSCRVDEVRPGDVVDLGGLMIRAVPAAHDGRRHPLSHHGGAALGFVIDGGVKDPTRVWFAGDTGLFSGMDDIWPIDVAVVPIGGWGPTLGPTHLDPTQAAEAVRRVGASDAIPIHYGTFWPVGLRPLKPRVFQQRFIEPGPRFAAALRSCCPMSTAHLLKPGGTAIVPDPGHHEVGR
jgi:L-ascorbate metabolism protein UlaG (beta-lactamase superfamily)